MKESAPYQRELGVRLLHLAESFPVLVLTGARQTGKTTLLRSVFRDHHYVSLDLPSVAENAERDPGGFLAAHPAPLLVDEVQYAPSLFRHLKALVDDDRHAHGRWILTGSQRFPLMNSVSESLAGRAAIVQLEGLSFTELAQRPTFGRDPATLATILCRGAFPELWRQPALSASDFYSSYLATYLERDVRQLLHVTSLRDFERFLRVCAARNGQLLDKTALASDVGVTAKTISAWLSVLEASGQVSLLEPYFANLGKRLIKSPKLYFCDTGLLCYLLGITTATILSSPFLGYIWETALYAELRKANQVRSSLAGLWFYRDSEGREVDLVVLRGGRADLIECKWTEIPQRADVKWLESVLSLVRNKAVPEFAQSRGLLACRTVENFPMSGEIRALHGCDLVKTIF